MHEKYDKLLILCMFRKGDRYLSFMLYKFFGLKTYLKEQGILF